jgi:hypothetical protein
VPEPFAVGHPEGVRLDLHAVEDGPADFIALREPDRPSGPMVRLFGLPKLRRGASTTCLPSGAIRPTVSGDVPLATRRVAYQTDPSEVASTSTASWVLLDSILTELTCRLHEPPQSQPATAPPLPPAIATPCFASA